jgi:hypothetical protein
MAWNEPQWRNEGIKHPPMLFKDVHKRLIKNGSDEEEASAKAKQLIEGAKEKGRLYISAWVKERKHNESNQTTILGSPRGRPPKPLSLVTNLSTTSSCPPLEDWYMGGIKFEDIDFSEDGENPCGLEIGENDLKAFAPTFKGDNEFLNGKKFYEEIEREMKRRGVSYMTQIPELLELWFHKPLREVYHHKEIYITNLWNSLPKDNPLFSLGSNKFWELFSNPHPQVLAIADVNAKNPRSLLIADKYFREKYSKDSIEWSKEKEEAIKEHDEYVKANSGYKVHYDKCETSCRKRIDKYVDDPTTHTIAQDIIETYLLMAHHGNTLSGIVPRKYIKHYLREHGSDRYKEPVYLDQKDSKGAWTSHFQSAVKHVPITTAFKRGKQLPKPVDQDVEALRNGEPTNAN